MAEAPADPRTARWVCTGCGYIYDPAVGDPKGEVEPGTPFEEIPETWCCPVCYLPKDAFDPL
jgi:rubredoxin